MALKTLRASEDGSSQGRARLRREARAAAGLSHAHIAAVFDVLEADGQVVVVFEYVEGETLAARLARGALPVVDALGIGCQLARAWPRRTRTGWCIATCCSVRSVAPS